MAEDIEGWKQLLFIFTFARYDMNVWHINNIQQYIFNWIEWKKVDIPGTEYYERRIEGSYEELIYKWNRNKRSEPIYSIKSMVEKSFFIHYLL